MAERTIGIIINGATSRIASTQHLACALVPIRDEGGLEVDGERIVPRPLLVGRNSERVEAMAKTLNVEDWTTDLDGALANPDFPIFFDGAVTHLRLATLKCAIEAGKHIYSEKPIAPSVAEGLELMRAADARGLKHGAVEDKIYLPGLRKLTRLERDGFFGQVRQFRLNFGWWVFSGHDVTCQRPSWNYKQSGGGGLVFDMHPHWRYVIEHILGPIKSVVAANWTAVPERIDEEGRAYAVDVEDSTSALLEMESGAFGTLTASWATRVRTDEPLAFQVDGTQGSAVAGQHRCFTQSAEDTPGVQWSANADLGADTRDNWQTAPDPDSRTNSYRVGWEGFLPHVVAGKPFNVTLAAGIRDIQFAEACNLSAAQRRWVDMAELDDG